MGRSWDLIGQTFGRLTVVEKAHVHQGHQFWRCSCTCGGVNTVSTSVLTSGRTKSCGCLQAENDKYMLSGKSRITHGLSKTRIYKIWKGMKNRCYDSNRAGYARYGGRGIVLCKEWEEDFHVFYTWAMNNGYKDNLTIERLDVDGNYCPENCTWIPKSMQSRNTSKTHKILYKGDVHTAAEISRIYGIGYNRMIQALKEDPENITTFIDQERKKPEDEEVM